MSSAREAVLKWELREWANGALLMSIDNVAAAIRELIPPQPFPDRAEFNES